MIQKSEGRNRTPEASAGGFRLPASDVRPRIFGILNITPDSFSDGGRFLEPDAALAHAHALVAGGADVIDIGAAASNPASQKVAPELEIGRLAPVVAALKKADVPVSIDSFSTAVQRWALGQGVAYLNDIQGFADPAFYPELAAAEVGLVVMHSVQGRGPATRIKVAAEEIFDRVHAFFERRIDALTGAGIARERLILDPGMGLFLGTDAEASFTILRRIADLKRAFGLPVLISVSRKSFLRKMTARAPGESGPATLAAELFAYMQGADCLRTHDPAAISDAVTIWRALAGAGSRG